MNHPHPDGTHPAPRVVTTAPKATRAFTNPLPALLCGLVLSAALSASAATNFVNVRAQGRGDGSSWANAWTNLQSALAVARSGDSIHVAEGTYYPGTQREDSFRMVDGVRVLGGYSGSATNASLRDPVRYRTILSGTNSYHVVWNENVGHRSVWDGFTITGGNADGPSPHQRGGGMYNRRAMVVVRDCVFESNNGGERAGGVFNESSSVLFDRCVFRNNNAFAGSGLTDEASKSLLIDCVFEGNSGAYTAGANFSGDSRAQLSRCVFRNNWVWDSGGAMGAGSQGNALLVACTFEDNTAEAGSAGAIWNWYDGDITLDRCLFRGHRRGVIYNRRSRLTAANCLFIQNANDVNGGVIDNTEGSTTHIESCTFASNTAPNGRSISAGTWGTQSNVVEVINSILWNGGNEVWNQDNSTIRIEYSTVAGGYPGISNSVDNPLFFGADDYRLQPVSPCIDRGFNLTTRFRKDFDDRDRPADGNYDGRAEWDQGAFEWLGRLPFGPQMTVEPAGDVGLEGSTLRLIGVAAGTPFCTYQWQKDDSGWRDLPGETEPRLVLTNLQSFHTGNYRVVARDTMGSVTSVVAAVLMRSVPGVWVPVAPMKSPRFRHTATVLASGRVLVAGGDTGNNQPLSSAELFDPGTYEWTTTGSMNEPRVHHEGILLPSGKVLVAGGMTEYGRTTASAELYDPVAGRWTRASPMAVSRSSFTIVLLNGSKHPGKVLAMGGTSYPNGGWGGGAGSVEALTHTEMYDPVADRWTSTADLITGRTVSSPAAVPFPDGSVLIVGGGTCCPYSWFGAPELADPEISRWKSLGPKATGATHKPVLLPSGEVLVAGGWVGSQGDAVFTADAEIYDPVRGTWRATGAMSNGRCDFTLTLLSDGDVLAAGGSSGGWGVCRNLSSAELYDPATGQWTATADLGAARALHTANRLLDGRILVAGGQSRDLDCSGPVLASAELYIPQQVPQPTNFTLQAQPVGQWPPHLKIPAWRLAVDQGRVFSIRLQGNLSCLGLDADGAPVELGRLGISATLWDFDVEGDLALATVAYLGQLLFIDVRNPAEPRLIVTHTPARPPRLVRIRGQHAFVLAQDGTLDILDVHDPLHPTNLGSIATAASGAFDLHVTEDDAWLVSNMASAPGNLRRIDIRNPAVPIDRTPPALPGLGRIDSGVLTRGTLLYGTSLMPSGFHVLELQNPDQPALLHTVALPADARLFALSPSLAAVLANGVQILDLANPRQPQPVATLVVPGEPADIEWDGARFWIAGDAGITIFDPAQNPVLPDFNPYYAPFRQESGAVDVRDNLAAVASPNLGVTFFDVSRPDRPRPVSAVPVSRARDVRLDGSWAYVASTSVPGFTLIDVHNPAAPITVTQTVSQPVQSLDVRGSHVLLGMLHGGMRVLDVSQPTAPREVASLPTRFSTNRIRIAGDLAWVAESGGFEVFDVHEPAAPVWLGRHEMSEMVTGLDIVGSLACVATERGSLRLFEVSQPAEPRLLWTGYESRPFTALRASTSMAVAIANSNRTQVIAVPLRSQGAYGVSSLELASAGFHGLALQGSRVFLADGLMGLRILDLHLGRTQSLALPLPAEISIDDPPLVLRPIASSGLPVTLAVVSGPARIEGNLLVPVGHGKVTLRLAQQGSDEWLPAERILDVLVRGRSQTLTWTQVPTGPLEIDRSYAVEVTASSGLPVVLRITAGSASLSGNQLVPTGRVPLSLSAVQAGDERWHSVSASLDFEVIGLRQSIAWIDGVGSTLQVGEAYSLTAVASSGLPVKVALSSGFAVLEGNQLRPTLRGTLVLLAEQAGDIRWDPASRHRVFEVVGPPQTFFVRHDSPDPAPPYSSWATAAWTIQDALALSASDDTVLVTNGVYGSGSVVSPAGPSRVMIPAGVIVRSVHGPDVTVIEGDPTGIRCAHLGDGAVLSGFTLRLGRADIGGGVSCMSARSLVTNCILTGNSATNHGGGATGGTLQGCTLSGNRAPVGAGASGSVLEECVLTGNIAERAGGGAFDATLRRCDVDGNSAAIGGGAYLGYLEQCTLTRNSADDGGGAYDVTLRNSVLVGNTARNRGGGVISSRLYQCTVTGNSAAEGGGVAGRWAEIPGLGFQVPAPAHVFNGIVVGNTAASPTHANHAMAQFTHSCTAPHPGGIGNLDTDPRLLAASHLAPDSPCLAAGHPDHAIGRDLDGDPWASPPPMGADQPRSTGPLSVRILAGTLEGRTDDALRFVALADGAVTRTVWDFGDGVTLTNAPAAVHAWIRGGTHTVTFTGYNDALPEGVQDHVQVTITEISPQPRISDPLVPSAAAPYGPAFVITVQGTGFTPGSVVAWNGQPRPTTYLDRGRLTAVIGDADIARPGAARVTVINPGDHRVSEPVLFPVAIPVPTVITRRTDYPAPPDVIDLMAVDLNGDGFTDLVEASWDAGTVTVMVGRGDGTFQAGESYGACGAHGLATGDFNQDGFKDLVVAERACGSILMLLGKGDGTFLEGGRWDVPANGTYGPFAVLAGDFDRDGSLDAVSSNEGGASLTVFLGQGNGTFQWQHHIPIGRICRNLASGDFNQDRLTDLAVVTEDGHLFVVLGVGDGTFLPPVDYDLEADWSIAVAAADLNGDGWLDLAASAGDDALYLLFGQGDGTFTAGGRWPIGVVPFSIACGDLNADGHLDLVLGTATSNTLALLPGNGDGTFAEPVQYPGPQNPRGIAVGDFNDDGRLDVALGSQGNNTLSIHLQVTASFLPPIHTGEWLVLRWNDHAKGLRLQYSPTLHPPQWSDVPGTQDLTGIAISPVHASGFFRLVRP